MSEELYQLFIDYFGDLSLKRIQKTQDYCIYACNVSTGLSECRVIYVIVPFRFSREEQTTLSQLPWVSFQTRTSDEPLADAPKNSVIPSRQAKEALSQVFDSVNRSTKKTDYRSSEMVVDMFLLLDPKKKNFFQYPDRIKLCSALETYKCGVQVL
jgi:hypothetical protein